MTSSISTTVNKTVTLGATGYTSPLTITSSGVIDPPDSERPNAILLAGIYAPAGLTSASIANFGHVTGGSGVYIYGGSAGPGGAGMNLQSSVAVTNAGAITGGRSVYSYLATPPAGGAGVDFAAGGELNNSGIITGGPGINAVSLNGEAGGIGALLSGAGIFSNSGTVAGGQGGFSRNPNGGAGGAGVELRAGATLTNTHLITGGAGNYGGATAGVGGAGGAGGTIAAGATLINIGTIDGGVGGSAFLGTAGAGGFGFYMDGGLVINTGSIIGGAPGAPRYGTSGAPGIGIFMNGGTLITSGLVSGPNAAINFGANASTLIVEAGARFTGNVFANGNNDELAIGGATSLALASIGEGNAKYNFFKTIAFEPGVIGSIYGSIAGLAAGQTIEGFSPGDTIELTGFVATSETVINGIGIVLNHGTTTETLDINGSLATRNFQFSTGGGNTTIIGKLPSVVSTGISSTVTLTSLESLTVTSTGGITPFAYGATGLVEAATATGAYVLNQGTILGAVGQNGSGNQSNATGGGSAVNFQGGVSLVNTGQITGGEGGISLYTSNGGGGVGVYLAANDAMRNSGAVSGGEGGGGGGAIYRGGGGNTGINLAAGSYLNNTGRVSGGEGGSGYTDTAGTGGNGGFALNLASGATLLNTGVLTGGRGGASYYSIAGGGGTGVYLQAGASFTNAGQITGGYGGYAHVKYGQVGGTGAYINNGATLINNGNIAGGDGGPGARGLPSSGVRNGTGVQINGGLLIDSGVVAAGGDNALIRAAFNAIHFGALAGKLIVEPGASFSGKVSANAAVADVLEVSGTSSSLLAGIGYNFTGFSNISFASGAAWGLAGNTLGLAAHQLITGFTFGDAIDLIGFAASGETFVAGAGLTLSNGGTSETLDLSGSFTGDEFLVSAAAGTSMITLGLAGAPIAPGMVAALPAGSIASATLAGGTLDVSGSSTLGALAITGGSAEISLSPGAGLTVSTPLSLAPGATLSIAGGTLVLDGGLSLTGAITESGTDLFDNGSLVNDGNISLDPSTLTIEGSLTGTGVTTLGADSTLDVTGNIAAGQTIVFAGTDAVLQITDTAAIAGTLSVASAAATIDITDLPFANFISASFNSISDLLGITYTGAASPLELHGNFAGQTFSEQSDGNAGTDVVAICYLRGTSILTPTGEVLIEALAIGDAVVTRFGGIQKIRWIGEQKFAWRFLRGNLDKIPVRITPGALGERMPARELAVSPGHSLLLGETLILARDLVNGVTITQDICAARDTGTLEYFQIELDAHDCVIAEGCWAETFADAPGLRAQFHNAAAYHARYPEAPPPGELRLCAERPQHGAKLAAALLPVITRAWARTAPGRLEASIERVSDWRVEGWAQDAAHPSLPVVLEFWFGERRLGATCAVHGTFSFASTMRLGAARNLHVRRQNTADILPTRAAPSAISMGHIL